MKQKIIKYPNNTLLDTTFTNNEIGLTFLICMVL